MGEYDCLKLDNQMCFPLYVASKEIVKQYKPFLEEIDMTYTQYITMMVLWECKEITVKELGQHLYLDSGTLTPVLKTLEKKGMVTRQRSKEDERVLNVSITKAGEAVKKKAVKVPEKMKGCISLSKEEAGQLCGLLHKLLRDM